MSFFYYICASLIHALFIYNNTIQVNLASSSLHAAVCLFYFIFVFTFLVLSLQLVCVPALPKTGPRLLVLTRRWCVPALTGGKPIMGGGG